MKKIISLILVFASLFTVLAFAGSSAEAASLTSYYYEQRQQFNANYSFSGGGFYGNVSYFVSDSTDADWDTPCRRLYVKTSINGKSKLVTGNVPYWKYSIYKNYIYYVYNHYIVKCAVNGKYKKAIIRRVGTEDIIPTNNRLFFITQKNYVYGSEAGLHVCDLNGKGYKTILKGDVGGCYSWGSKLYFYFYDAVNKLMCYNMKTGKLSTIKSLSNQYSPVAMDGKYYYVTQGLNRGRNIYRIDTATKAMKKVAFAGDQYYLIAVAGGKIYANVRASSVNSNYNFYYRYNPKTVKFVLLRALTKNVTDEFSGIGFYKNKLVVNRYVNGNPTHAYYILDTV